MRLDSHGRGPIKDELKSVGEDNAIDSGQDAATVAALSQRHLPWSDSKKHARAGALANGTCFFIKSQLWSQLHGVARDFNGGIINSERVGENNC